MEQENMILEYYDNKNNTFYYVEYNIYSLLELANELIIIRNNDESKLGEVTINKLINYIKVLINGNTSVLDKLFYQSKFTDKYSKKISELEELSVNKIKNVSVEDILHNDALEGYKKSKEQIDLLKKKMYFEETLYREYLLKILECLNLTKINEKSLKKVK